MKGSLGRTPPSAEGGGKGKKTKWWEKKKKEGGESASGGEILFIGKNRIPEDCFFWEIARRKKKEKVRRNSAFKPHPTHPTKPQPTATLESHQSGAHSVQRTAHT